MDNTNNIFLQFLYRIAVNCIGLGLASFLFMNMEVTSFGVLVVAAIILTVLNFIVKPLLIIISLPVMFLTMGLAYFMINGIIILLVSGLVSGFDVKGLWAAIGVSLVVSVINLIFDFFAANNLRKEEYR